MAGNEPKLVPGTDEERYSKGIERSGLKPINERYDIGDCDDCKVLTTNGWSRTYSSKAEAVAVWDEYGNVFLDAMIKALWKEIWDGTFCTNVSRCKSKKSCSDTPSFVKVVTWQTFEFDTDGHPIGRAFRNYVRIQRLIKCISSDAVIVDDDPKIDPPPSKPEIYHSKLGSPPESPPTTAR